jgi:peptide/nickel transport system ATP-binding protein
MLELVDVAKTYRVGTFGRGELQAVSDVSFAVDRGEVVSLIGESGSGKSTIGRMILRLLEPSAGAILLDGTPIPSVPDYYRRVQGVFQDPFSSFNPIFKVDRIFGMLPSSRDVRDVLSSVGLDSRQVLGRYAHQLSGGQLQRLLVARALMLDIDYLVADEITSMLDASTRIDVLNLLGSLRSQGLGVLFITHDLSLGHYVSDRTIILRRGSVVEHGDTSVVYASPEHEYTRMLLDSVPRLDSRWVYGEQT